MPKHLWFGLVVAIVAVAALVGVLWFVLVTMQGAGAVIYVRQDGVPTSAIATLVAGGVLVVALPIAYLLGRWAERRGLW